MANEGNTIENKVASNTSLITLDLETFYPKIEMEGFDIKPFLFKEMILKEKDFREALKNVDWEKFRNKAVYIFCSVDTIIPSWAYMLVARYLTTVTDKYIFGDKLHLVENLMLENMQKTDFEQYKNKKMLIKGCSNEGITIPDSIFVEISRKLLPLADSLMYGEACSNVPIFKSTKKL